MVYANLHLDVAVALLIGLAVGYLVGYATGRLRRKR